MPRAQLTQREALHPERGRLGSLRRRGPPKVMVVVQRSALTPVVRVNLPSAKSPAEKAESGRTAVQGSRLDCGVGHSEAAEPCGLCIDSAICDVSYIGRYSTFGIFILVHRNGFNNSL